MRADIVQRLDRMLQLMERGSKASSVWLTVDQLADYIGLSVHTIYQYVSNGRIPFRKIPGSSRLLFYRAHIDAWILGDERQLSADSEAMETVREIWDLAR